MILSVGDTIELTTKKEGKIRKNVQILEALEKNRTAEWIKLEKDKFKATFERLPERKELNPEIKESLIVEFYSK